MKINDVHEPVKKEQKEIILVERKPFFYGLATVLSIFESKNFDCLETRKKEGWEEEDEFYDCCTRYFRTYAICIGEQQLISHTMEEFYYREKGHDPIIRRDNEDVFARYEEIRNLIEPLTIEYPYLIYFINQVKQICLTNQGKLTEAQMLMIAKDYANLNFNTENRCDILNKIITYSIHYYKK